MMQLLLYQINWPAILDFESVGTGPSSYLILLPFRGNFCVFHQVCSKFQKAICFRIILRWHFIPSWAVQETGMLPLLSSSCYSDVTAWLKTRVQEEEDLVIPKLQVTKNSCQVILISYHYCCCCCCCFFYKDIASMSLLNVQCSS